MKKTKEFKKGKLTLNKEAIVSLNESQLKGVVGAGSGVGTCAGNTCQTTSGTTCNSFTPVTCTATCCSASC